MSWILVLSYWVHLLATVIWFGSLLLMAVTAVPALRRAGVADNEWLMLQKRVLLWSNLSLVLLLLTGFLQMTNSPSYTGFLTIDSTWAWALLVKHVLYIVVIAIAAYWQFGYFPAVERTALLAEQRPQLAATERALLAQREKQLLWVNLITAVLILLCTAVLTVF